MGEEMKVLSRIELIFILSLFGCHFHHDSSSKDKYKKLSKMNKQKILIKEISNENNFIYWQERSEKQFLVKKVWSDSKAQTCKNCHQGFSLENMKGKFHQRSHWHIKLKHASGKIMNCKTCHNQSKVWQFNFGKKTIGANYTPKMCLQCHFKQGKDWATGAHGKRATGWQYERGVYSCVFCHNPHRPAFKKRWPKVEPYRPINNEGRQ